MTKALQKSLLTQPLGKNNYFANLLVNDTILSIVVLVENGGHGGEVSAPIARKAFDFYFSTYN